MSKSIKLKNDTYIDSLGVIHKPINGTERINLREALSNWGCGTTINDYEGDLNNLIRAGYYTTNSKTLNCPSIESYYILVLTKNVTFYVLQIAIPRTKDSNSIWIRKKDGADNWSGWSNLYTNRAEYVGYKYLGQNPDIDTVDYRRPAGMYGLYGCTKAPSTDIGVLEVKSYSNDWCVQVFSSCYGKTWYRTFTSGTTWSSWKEININQKETIWNGRLFGGETLSLNVSGYSKLKIYAISHSTTLTFEIDLTKETAYKQITSYPYAGSIVGAYINTNNIIEQHSCEVLVNTAKDTIFVRHIGYVRDGSTNLRNNTGTYYVYKIEGMVD